MQSDPIRQRIRDLLRERDATMRDASRAIGRNPAYMHQFLERGVPRVLNSHDRRTLAAWLGCDAEELRHAVVPPRKPRRKGPRGAPRGLPGVRLTAIPEVEVEASAGFGALNDEYVAETARWYLPETVIRHECGATPDNLRILRVRGESMEPEIRDGDRLLVDTARRIPATGELFVLWDGAGLVVKRTEIQPDADPPKLRLISSNPEYEPYTCLAEDAHIVGKVLWTLARA